MKRLLAALSCCVALALPAWGQFELGSIVGLISDPQKAPVAGAVVEFRSLTTNVKRESVYLRQRRIQFAAAAAGPLFGHGAAAGIPRQDQRKSRWASASGCRSISRSRLGAVNEQVNVSATAATDRDGIVGDRAGARRRRKLWTCR